MNQIIGRFVPFGNFNRGAIPFNVLTKVASDYMPPAWKGIREGGEGYHVIEKSWRFEPVEWDGVGLPPVGTECELSTAVEIYTHSGSTDFEEGTIVVVGGVVNFGLGDFVAVKVKGTNCITDINPVFLRPIRSEADKKRDEAIESIKAMLMYDYGDDPRLNDAVILYDAIAAGKIPHIRIE